MLQNIPIRIIELLRVLASENGLASLNPREQHLILSELQADLHQCAYCFKGLFDGKDDALLSLEMVGQRSQLMALVHGEILHLLKQQQIEISSSLLLALLWYYWLPLGQSLAWRHTQVQHPLIQGLLGGQGVGKTTLGQILKIVCLHLGKTFMSISLDDFYKTYGQRQQLRERRPDLIWRGPPSTHDIQLCQEVLQQLRDPQVHQVSIPRFDKSLHQGGGDRIAPEICDRPDITLFEGWFVGMRPLPIAAFNKLIPPILSESDRQFALDCNAELDNYVPLWSYLDSLIVLMPEEYTYSLAWRLEAEHKLAQTHHQAMDDREIIEFVEYFWKALHPELFLPPLLKSEYTYHPQSMVDLVIQISRSHLPQRIYTPKHLET
jgi:D-glycerate 3-kinase